MMEVPLEWIKEYKSLIEEGLENMYDGDANLWKACKYALLSGGKRIRAILALLACEAVGGRKDDGLHVALAYELAHTASLIQDDLIDNSDTRRGKTATHVKFGDSLALLASDVLLIDMLLMLSHYRFSDSPKDVVMDVLNCFNRSVRETALGETLELELIDNDHITEDEYLKIVGLKTAPLISTAIEAGAIIGGRSKEQIEFLSEFGDCIGIAWQLKDDILDFTGTRHSIGKPIFNDVGEKKRNIVYIRAYEEASDSEKRFLESLIGNNGISEADMERTKEILRKYGIIEKVTELANTYKEEGLSALRKIPNNIARKRLEEISHFVINRMA